MAFRGITCPVQVRQLFYISQFNLLNFFFNFLLRSHPEGSRAYESSRGGIRFRFSAIQFGIFSPISFSCSSLRL